MTYCFPHGKEVEERAAGRPLPGPSEHRPPWHRDPRAACTPLSDVPFSSPRDTACGQGKHYPQSLHCTASVAADGNFHKALSSEITQAVRLDKGPGQGVTASLTVHKPLSSVSLTGTIGTTSLSTEPGATSPSNVANMSWPRFQGHKPFILLLFPPLRGGQPVPSETLGPYT